MVTIQALSNTVLCAKNVLWCTFPICLHYVDRESFTFTTTTNTTTTTIAAAGYSRDCYMACVKLQREDGDEARE